MIKPVEFGGFCFIEVNQIERPRFVYSLAIVLTIRRIAYAVLSAICILSGTPPPDKSPLQRSDLVAWLPKETFKWLYYKL